MKVKLIHHAPDESIAERASGICVGIKEGTSKNLQRALFSGHLSVIEHLPLSFSIEGVSRALTHQLVRHRIASYSQESQRYVKVDTDNDWYIDLLVKEGLGFKIYENTMRTIAKAYNDLLELGYSEEDARLILPNACKTKIIVSMNARSFVEQARKRLCNRSQWEIRKLFKLMRKEVKDVYPSVYELAKPPCATGICPELKTCGVRWRD